jgi:hypothetical protein
MATLRQQLRLKRSLRHLRTWAPPISIGLFVGAGAFLAAERLVGEPANHQPAQATAFVSYASCEAARAAGAAPLHRGQPGYNRRLDADRDGVACEPHPPNR